MSIELFAVSLEATRISAIAIIAFVGLAALTAIGLLVASIISQKKYNSDVLPSLAELNPEPDDIYAENDWDEPFSAFSFEDENEENPLLGDSAAEELLKDVKAVEAAPDKTKSFNPFFGRKK